MEEFRSAGQKMQFTSTVVVGATFGVFLTLGQAWSEFLKEAIFAAIPQEFDNDVLNSFIYASSATLLCLFTLVCLIKCETYMLSPKTMPMLPQIVQVKKRKRRSRRDIANKT